MSLDSQKASATPEPASTPDTTLQAFQEYLTRIVRKNWEGRRFYNPEDIKRWMEIHSTVGGGQAKSNLAKLLDEVKPERNFLRHPREDALTKLPILFAILLDDRIQHGHLIHCFKKVVTNDSELMLDEKHFDLLHGNLMELKNEINVPVEKLLEDFKKVRLEYCPMRIGIDEDVHLVDGAILPFCKALPINQKGGTANVVQYMIRVDLVPDTLRSTLEGSRKTDEDLGECYSVAVKSYDPGEIVAYQLEVEAFKALKRIPGVIKFLGEYNKRTFKGSSTLSHHVILEFGEHDLDEYLADNFPPILYKETKGFWDSLFDVAQTLERLHESQYDGIPLSGWHGDIKPDNILRVNGEFKLADFGFTRFERRTSATADPKTHLDGVTKSFGAPEICTSGQNDGYTQKIDTWSFGCVLSSVATWVILGQQAYDHYPEIRKVAIKSLKDQRKLDQSIHAPDANDAFHDGVNVLPAVIQWHDLLRNSVRRSDSVSARILDLIEEGMLVGDVQKRWKVNEMHQRLRKALKSADRDHQEALKSADHHFALKSLSPHMLEALLSLDKDAPASPITAGEARSIHLTRHGPGTGRGASLSAANKNDRVRKSERLDKNVRAKVAFREQVITSELKRNGANIPEEGQEDSQEVLVPDRMNAVAEVGKGKRPMPPSIHITDPVTDAMSCPQPPDVPDITLHSSHHKQPIRPAVPSIPEQYQSEKTPPSFSAAENSHLEIIPPQSPVQNLPRTSTGTSASPKILLQYDELKKEYTKLSVRYGLKGLLKDEQLEKYIKNRDIKFVVDNASSMRKHWEEVQKVLLALAMKIGRLDEDGIDLVYTIGDRWNLKNVKGSSIFKNFKNSTDKAGERISVSDKASMRQTLGSIFTEYLKNHDKRMTLIILTDGKWEGSRTPDDVEILIDKFVVDLQKERRSLEQRWFSIQFVYFGNDLAAISRLKGLDDEMKRRFKIEDIIDSKPWNHEPPDELILGSIEEGVDEEGELKATSHEASSSVSSTLWIQINPPDIQRRPSSSSSRGSNSSRKRFGFIKR